MIAHLPHNHEDQSLDPLDPHEVWAGMMAAGKSSTLESWDP